MQPTPEQAAIISAPVGNLLVSAAAGSGKTAVLTDRIVRRVIDGQLDIRQVLVMTFTEAAARNMKEKIGSKLQAALDAAAGPTERRHLGRQLSLLPGAAISTIHAFCLDVIRNFYYCALDEQGKPLVEPGFSIDGGVEADLLLRQTLDDWMGSQYEAIDLAEDDPASVPVPDWRDAFYRLIEGYGDSSGDQGVRDLMLHLHHYLRSLPDYPGFVQDRLDKLAAAATDFPASRHCETLLRMLRLRLDRALDHAAEMDELLAAGIRFIANPERNRNYLNQFRQVLATLRELDRLLATGCRDWDLIRELGGGLAALELPRASRGDSPEKQQFMAVFCEYAAEVIHFLAGSCGTAKCRKNFIFDTRPIFGLAAAEIESDIAAMLPSIRLLFELVLGLDDQYSQRKRAAGMIDFGDFEHLALKILQQEEPRQYYQKRFQEVYVDEYQDTSSIQEAIIRAVSDGNCLMVGDVKQSIYRFRHARPQLFLARATAFQEGQDGCLFELNRNFRSVAGILAAANDLFSQLMSRGAGEIDYDDSQALRSHRPDAETCPTPVSLLLLNRLPANPESDELDSDQSAELAENQAGYESAQDPASSESSQPEDAGDGPAGEAQSRDQQEALLVVRQMLLLHGEGCPWRDMVILSRTRSIGLAYRTQLESYGIPVLADNAEVFMDSPILRQMEALVHVLDNIRQDIPLAAVMRADLQQGAFQADELARIRLFAKQSHLDSRFFHQAVLAYAVDGPDEPLRRRLADFLEWLAHLRAQEQILSLSELISLIYAETGWLNRLAARPDGESLIRQLQQFRQWAEQFESRRQRGLYAFARYLEKLREQGGAEAPAAAETDRDAVRILTIHGSKGLEFPIVFLVGTGYGITPKDSQDSILLSENLGIGPDFADPEQQIRYPTHLKLAMLEEIKAASLAEELRLLYVAMTRAMDRLFIAGTVKLRPGQGDSRLSHLLGQARQCANRQLPDYLVLSGKTYLEWLILAIARQKDPDLSWLADGVLAGALPETGRAAVDPPPVWTVTLFQLENLLQELAGQSVLTEAPVSQPTVSSGIDPAAIIAESIGTGREPGGQDERYMAASQLVAAPYRYEQAARIPLKMTVSELKHQDLPEIIRREEDGSLAARGIGLSLHGLPELNGLPVLTESSDHLSGTLPANRLGTLLHAVIRFLDLAAARKRPDLPEITRQLAAMRQTGIFNDQEAVAIELHRQDLLAFVQSDLAGEMNRALANPRRPIYQEMPFTLAVPACQVHTGCPGLGLSDRVLVQGIIDCWFEGETGVTLVDFKSDRLSGDPDACRIELKRRYESQLEYYARAIQAATGKLVTRRLIWMIRQARAYELTPTGH